MTLPPDTRFVEARRFSDWRETARQLLSDAIEPQHTHWIDLRQTDQAPQIQLFDVEPAARQSATAHKVASNHRVPPEFVDLAKQVAANRNPGRWQLLYRMLWRLTHGEHHLLEIASDSDCLLAREMAQAVHRDAHKMKAFVRFRKCQDAEGDLYVAWHRPLHYVVELTADFFSRRFDVMRWLIMTPDESVAWNGEQLAFGPGVSIQESAATAFWYGGRCSARRRSLRRPMEDLLRSYLQSSSNQAEGDAGTNAQASLENAARDRTH